MPGPAPFVPHTHALCLAEEFLSQLAELTQSLDVSLAALCLAGWVIILWHLTERSELLIGSGHNGRKYEGLSEAIGLFAKYLPLVAHLAPELPFSDLVKRIEEQLSETQQWQEYFSWEQVQAGDEQRAEPFYAFGFDYQVLPVPIQAGSL